MVGPFNGTKNVEAVGVVRLIKVQKGLDRWFKEKWVDVSRKDKDGKHPPCGRKEAKTSSKGYPKCRPSVRVSSKTPKTAGEMTSGQKRAATKRKRSKRQGVKGKPTMVKGDPMGLAFRLLKGWEDYINDRYGTTEEESVGYKGPSHIERPIEEQAYALARQDLPYDSEQFPKYSDYEDEIEYMAENILAHMLLGDEYKDLRDLYTHHSEPPPMRDESGPYSIEELMNMERDDYIERNLDWIYGPQKDLKFPPPATGTATMHEEDGQPAWPTGTLYDDESGFTRSEPMDLAMQLLKDRKSPEAFRHKKEYDTKYESSPERVKYREELNRERRRRGMYGDHSGRDISHTEGGKLTVESEHANRARHFKDRGTLRPTTSQ